jgi:FtsP/CotA-like multicopper oxidase with cupredoxin domain
MSHSDPLGRRDFLCLSGCGLATFSAGTALGSLLGAGQASMPAFAAAPKTAGPDADLEIALRATPGEVPILSGKPTRVWMYQGRVLKGDPASLQALPGSYLGPILRVRQGQKVRIRFANDLSEQSIVHWHGLHVPDDMDGHPRHAVGPGQTYTYEFQVLNRAGTYWFHPHPHKITGPQVYRGLAGLFLVSDAEEADARLPSGGYDVPLVIQDRTFDAGNQLVYLPGGMMDQMMGFLGDRILVNGRPDFVLPVAPRPSRLRVLNGSNSRIYKLGWEDGTPLTVIATDGGLLERPVERSYVTLGPAERVELWADFSGRPLGSELRLQSRAFGGAEAGDMGMMMGRRTALPDGGEFSVLRVRVDRRSGDRQPLPERLSAVRRYRLEDAVNRTRPRTFTLAAQGMGWTINGRTFEMEAVAADEAVKLGTLEVWEFINTQGTMMMMGGGSTGGGGMGMGHGGMSMGQGGMGMGQAEEMAHPMHIHGLQFQVLERQVRPELAAHWETVRAGYVDEGWKDTVLVMPGERVKLLLKYEDFTGLYLYHCHNLEHEDLGMMRNYRIGA